MGNGDRVATEQRLLWLAQCVMSDALPEEGAPAYGLRAGDHTLRTTHHADCGWRIMGTTGVWRPVCVADIMGVVEIPCVRVPVQIKQANVTPCSMGWQTATC